jgi:hypothetical protein
MNVNIKLTAALGISLLSFLNNALSQQTIGTFNSIIPTLQTENLVLPGTHTFQRIIKTGDQLSGGGTLGRNLDYTGYVPISGSSTSGYLSISSEDYPAQCAILSVLFDNGAKKWTVASGNKVDFPVPDIGQVAAFCAGTITPNNTIMVCEEFAPALDDNSDGYQDLGWIIEIDPVTHSVINQDGVGGVDKLWALGREMHEDIAIKKDGTAAYWTADNSTTGYVYKFVPQVPNNFSFGLLYVLKTSNALGNGTWELINNTTKSDRNNTAAIATIAGGYNFSRAEGIELGPDGKVYFASTTSGRIYRFEDAGNTVTGLEVFVESTAYDVDGSGPAAPEPWGTGADNIAFDGEGNLWVLQDGGKYFMWVVSPTHTAANPAVRLFATMPAGGEPTGISFSPDYKYLFMSVQHPSVTNTSAQTDATGASVVFNTHTTIVIARKEFLGVQDVVLPVTFVSFDIKEVADRMQLNWSVANVKDHSYFEVERSVDGINFKAIGKVQERINNRASAAFQFIDKEVPLSEKLYYRIKQCDENKSCYYSPVQEIKLHALTKDIKLYPVPVSKVLQVKYIAATAQTIDVHIINSLGTMVTTHRKIVTKGYNTFSIETSNLPAGKYILLLQDEKGKRSQPFTKQ